MGAHRTTKPMGDLFAIGENSGARRWRKPEFV
jgi:hypothetical protein